VHARGERVHEPPEVAALKGSGVMAEVLEQLLWSGVSVPEAPVEVAVGRTTVSVTPDDVRDAIAAARERARSYQGARERFRERLAGVVAGALDPGDATEADLLRAVRASKGYAKLAEKAWPRVSADQLFRRLFNKRRLTGLLPGDDIALLTSHVPRDKRLQPSDVPLLDEARWLVDPDLKTYGHVVVDEAQNLSAMALRVVSRRARRRSLTILGDLAQRTDDSGLGGWGEVLRTAGVPRYELTELEVSYRVPGDFLRVAAAVAPPGTAVPRGVRDAPWPAVAFRVEDVAAKVASLADRMAAVGSVAVIAPDALHDDLAGADADRAGALTGGVDLLSLRTVKGLEFDAAIVVEPAAILAQELDGGAGGLYTALTRSTRALAIVHAQPLPEGLELLSSEPAGWLA
jgi:hypothetical protein